METLHTKQELTPENAEALTKWLKNGSEVMWKGIFPPSITHILKNMGMHTSKASTWPDKMRDILLDGATRVYGKPDVKRYTMISTWKKTQR